jgi:hypothetical protein
VDITVSVTVSEGKYQLFLLGFTSSFLYHPAHGLATIQTLRNRSEFINWYREGRLLFFVTGLHGYHLVSQFCDIISDTENCYFAANMDNIKDEPNLEVDTNPLVLPDEEKCVYVKEEECDLPAQICLVKEEVIVSIFSQNKF